MMTELAQFSPACAPDVPATEPAPAVLCHQREAGKKIRTNQCRDLEKIWGIPEYTIRHWKSLGARVSSKEIFISDRQLISNERRKLGYQIVSKKRKEFLARQRSALGETLESVKKKRNLRALERKKWLRNNSAEWRAKNLEWRRQNYRKKYYNDIQERLVKVLRRRLGRMIDDQRAQKLISSLQLVGCSIEELKRHIERQFSKEMTWGNYGTLWHIDHIIPCAAFNLHDISEQRRCFNYLNLRPLLAVENMKKGARIVTAQAVLGL
jgi:hypothetical protein